MGEIADAIVAGEICALCNIPFRTSYGYPVACRDCWDSNCGYQLAGSKTDYAPNNQINGVRNFLLKNGAINDNWDEICAEYYRPIKGNDSTREERCIEIQKDFSKFVKWFKQFKNSKK